MNAHLLKTTLDAQNHEYMWLLMAVIQTRSQLSFEVVVDYRGALYLYMLVLTDVTVLSYKDLAVA